MLNTGETSPSTHWTAPQALLWVLSRDLALVENMRASMTLSEARQWHYLRRKDAVERLVQPKLEQLFNAAGGPDLGTEAKASEVIREEFDDAWNEFLQPSLIRGEIEGFGRPKPEDARKSVDPLDWHGRGPTGWSDFLFPAVQVLHVFDKKPEVNTRETPDLFEALEGAGAIRRRGRYSALGSILSPDEFGRWLQSCQTNSRSPRPTQEEIKVWLRNRSQQLGIPNKQTKELFKEAKAEINATWRQVQDALRDLPSEHKLFRGRQPNQADKSSA